MLLGVGMVYVVLLNTSCLETVCGVGTVFMDGWMDGGCWDGWMHGWIMKRYDGCWDGWMDG